MNWLPAQLMKVSALVLPGDIKARMKQTHVVELSESIGQRTGKRPIHLPVIEYPSKELLAGGDRMAAQLLLGYKSVWVQPVSQLTPQERRDIVRDENLHRRVIDRDKLIRQRVAEREAEIEAQRILEQADRKPGRPKSAKGAAREQVAREIGTTPDAIRVAEARANAPHVHAWVEVEDDGDGEAHACACGQTRGTDPITGQPFGEELPNKYSETLAPPVETYGLQLLSPAEAADIRQVQAAIDQADAALRRAQSALGQAEGVALFRGLQQLIARVHEVAAEVRRSRPAAVCPYCKRLNGVGCNQPEFIGAGDMLGVAEELKLGGDQAVVVALGGRMVKYAFALAGKEPKVLAAAETGARSSAKRDTGGVTSAAAASPAAKRLTVVDGDGNPIVVEDDEDAPF